MAQAGYEGTELGPWGVFPPEPEALRRALDARELVLVAAFVRVPLRQADGFPQAEAEVRRTAELVARCGGDCLVLSDAGDDLRARVAGRPELTRTCGLRPEEWPAYGQRVDTLARVVRESYGLRTVFHPHGGTYVENPDEVEALLAHTDPDLVGLCLDTGHLAFGGSDPVASTRRYAGRITHVHLKDVDLPRLQVLLAQGLDYAAAAKQDAFVELGRGSVDLAAVAETLQQAGYRGWLVVEEDRVVAEHTDTLQSAVRNREAVRQLFGV